MTYDQCMLEVLDVTDGPFIRSFADAYSNVPNWLSYFFDWGIREPGCFVFAMVIFHPPAWFGSYPEGSGTLANVVFNATSSLKASCNIELVETVVLGEMENQIPHNTENGTYKMLLGDVDQNGNVGIADIWLASGAFGCDSEHPRWNSRADTDNDCSIDILDIYTVASHFGEEEIS